MLAAVEKIIQVNRVGVQPISLPSLTAHGIRAEVLRLDNIHPTISGNKWFKLKEYLRDALQTHHQGLLTFGGAYSNHLVATSCLAQAAGLRSVGMVRGEPGPVLSHTLQAAAGFGMQLRFLSREQYARKTEPQFLRELKQRFPEYYPIAEGGAGNLGVKGSEDILKLLAKNNYSHILCAVATATMLAGLVNASLEGQQVEGIYVLKGMSDQVDALHNLPIDSRKLKHCRLHTCYHFGGYAKKTPELLDFMNRFFQSTSIPTDFVYTAKLCFAALDLIEHDYFPKDSNLLLIHSGGLQGNLSLATGLLNF
jgi:1-aminocyclopropane-1-carboxylate deaminase